MAMPCKLYNHTGLHAYYTLDESRGDLPPSKDILLEDGVEVRRLSCVRFSYFL